jgi:putative ABC transport system substrate-binding protein
MIGRRQLIALIGSATAWPLAAQTARKREAPVVGVLSPDSPSSVSNDVFREGMQELGYVAGQSIRIEYRMVNGAFDRLRDFAAELVALDVDVIVAYLTQAALEAKKATSTVPIVMAGVADPVGMGLINSLSRPGGNVTGTSSIAADLVGKQMELIQEILPKNPSIAVLWNPANLAFQKLQLKQAEDASRATGVQLQFLPARSPDDFSNAFTAIRREGAQALMILGDPMFALHAESIARLALENQLPTMSANRRSVEAGSLIGFGPNYSALYKRAAVYVDKILKGAKPSDLPVEQPTKFQLLINLRTAKSLGLTIPPTLLARADEVIE